jgi:hypothetical protein
MFTTGRMCARGMRSSGTKEKDGYGVYGMVVLYVNVIIIAAGR